MKIVVFCPNWVGDAVMATPALRALRHRYPDAHITGLMKQSISETLAGSPWFDDELILEALDPNPRLRWWRAVRELQRQAFDLALLFPNNFHSASISWLGRAKRRVGYHRDYRGLLLTDRLSANWTWRGYPQVPLIDYYLELVRALDVTPTSKSMELFLLPGDLHQARQIRDRLGIAPNDPYVVINPGAAFGPAKRWPTESFAALAQRLVDTLHQPVIVICGPSERGIAREIVALGERTSAIHSLADEKVSLGLSKAIIAGASLMVTTDSGPRHFAAAFDVPVVSIFGPTHIHVTETYFDKEIRLQKAVPCGPCQKRVCPLGHHRCMKELGVDQVLSVSLELWRATQSDPAHWRRVA